MTYWQLPGPAKFIDEIVLSLLDGNSAIASVPKNLPDGHLFLVRQRIEERGLSWQRLIEPVPAEQILNWMASNIGITLGPKAVEMDLLKNEDGHLFVVEVTSPAATRPCADFMARFARASRGASTKYPPRILALWSSDLPGVPEAEIKLTVHLWDGVVDDLDMSIFAATHVRRHHHTDFSRSLAASIACKLAGNDAFLCEYLCQQPLPKLIEPVELLREYEKARGGNSGPSAASVVLALQDDIRGIQRLVWCAQMTVIYPLIEERRQEIVEKLKSILQVPYKSAMGTVTDYYDLEFKHILAQIEERKYCAPNRLFMQLGRLKRMRDTISHLNYIPADYLLDQDTVRSLMKTQ